ncbi:MAG: thioesterase family protein [Pseudomonadota bacterium]
MRDTLSVGETATRVFTVPPTKTVPALYPEAEDFAAMPAVFATGFMVGLLEWTCLDVLKPHLDEGEGSLGIHVDVSHAAATVPGQQVKVEATCTVIQGRRITFEVMAHDGVDVISKGTHQRMVVPWSSFVTRVNAKAARVGAAAIAMPGTSGKDEP